MTARPVPWSRAAAEKRLGPAAVAAARRHASAAPPLSPEIRAKLRALFQSAQPHQTATDAA